MKHIVWLLIVPFLLAATPNRAGTVFDGQVQVMPSVGLHSSGLWAPIALDSYGTVQTSTSDSVYNISSIVTPLSTGQVMIKPSGATQSVRAAPLAGLNGTSYVPMAVDGDGKLIISTSSIATTTSNVAYPTDGVATSVTNAQLAINNIWSAGVLGTLSITKNSTTLNVGAADVAMRAIDSESAALNIYRVPANAALALTDLSFSYVYADYNSGSPIWAVSTSILTINGRNKVLAAIAWRNGTSIDMQLANGWNVDMGTKRARRLFTVDGFQYAAGLAISSSNQNFSLTSGIVYFVDNLISIPAYNSATNAFTYIYRNGSGGFTRASANAIQNSTYDDGSGTPASFSGFRADYIYAIIDTPTRFVVVTGQQNYNSLANAQAGSFPAVLPPELAAYGLSKCVGRVIIQKNGTTLTAESPFVPSFR